MLSADQINISHLTQCKKLIYTFAWFIIQLNCKRLVRKFVDLYELKIKCQGTKYSKIQSKQLNTMVNRGAPERRAGAQQKKKKKKKAAGGSSGITQACWDEGQGYQLSAHVLRKR